MAKVLKILLKTAVFTLLLALCLSVFAYFALQMPSVQTRLTHKATEWLSQKLGGQVTIGATRINWFDRIIFENISIKDLQGREMIKLDELLVNCKTNFSFDLKNIVKFDNNLDYVRLKNPDVKIVVEKTGNLNIDDWLDVIDSLTANRDPKAKKTPNIPFTIDGAYVVGGKVSFNDPKYKQLPAKLFDNSNFTFENITGDLSDVFILGDTVAFKANKVSGIDKRSKLAIKKIKTDFLHCRTAMTLDRLTAKINNSTITNTLHFYYDKPSAFGDFFTKVTMKANLKDCVFDAQDLGRFAEEMYAYNEKYRLDAKMSGTFVNLTFKDFLLKFGQKTEISGEANFKGFPDLRKTFADLNLKNSKLSPSDFRQYNTDTEYQKYLTKLGETTISGIYKGLYNDFVSNFTVNSSGLGQASGLVTFKLTGETASSTYFGAMKINQFDLGKFTDNENLLGKITFDGKIKGKGLKIKEAAVELDGNVSQIFYSNYNFQNSKVNGKLSNSIFNGKIQINDPNLVANIDGEIDFNPALNNFQIKGNFAKANLKKLGLIKKDISIKTDFNFDFNGNRLDDWVGVAKFENATLTENQHSLAIDNLFINSFNGNNERRFTLNSDFFNGFIIGNYKPSELINDVLLMVKEYNMFFDTDAQKREAYYTQKRNFGYKSTATYYLNFKNAKPFFDFFEPRIYVSPSSTLQGVFNAKNDFISNVTGKFDTLSFDGNSFIKTNIDVKSTKSSVTSKLAVTLKATSQNQKLRGNVETQSAGITVFWNDPTKISFVTNILQIDTKSFANVGGDIDLNGDNVVLSIDPKRTNLMLVKNPWVISDGNSIRFENGLISFNNLSLSNRSQSVSWNGILSKNPNHESVLGIKNFELETLKPFTNEDLAGTANGQLKLKDYYKNPYWSSNLSIEKFTYQKSLMGDINTEANWDNFKNVLNVNGNLVRLGNEVVRVTGEFDPKAATNPLDLKAKLNNLDLKVLEGILADAFSEISGTANAELSVTGKSLNPEFNGDINIDNGSLKVNSTGGHLYFSDKIICNAQGFFTTKQGLILRDAPLNGNLATLKGGIFRNPKNAYSLGFNVDINDRAGFNIMNLSDADNEDFYGKAMATGNVIINGDFKNINIEGNLTSKKGTKITIPLDSKKKIDVTEEGIPFVGKQVQVEKLEDINKPKVSTAGVDLAFNLTFTPDAECEIIFDRTTNDVLNVFGNGKLSINYSTNGEFKLNGPYVIKSGKYNYSLQNLASLRKFSIVEGSQITWSGDPYDGILDMKAQYSTNIPVSKIASSLTNADANARYPVNVVVTLTDKLRTPNIKYDINFDLKQIPVTLQTDILGFQQKLKNDEQLLSRNVSSILIFNEIFPDNFVDAFTQQFLIQNVSNMLSNQIGNLANKLNPNLELGVQFGDLKQSVLNNLQLNFSWKFLNNRAKISGKSSFINSYDNALSTTSTAYQNQLSIGGELEYLLSQNGEYKFKLFSKSVPANYYLASSSGNVVVSGGNLIISKNFNSFFGNKKTVLEHPYIRPIPKDTTMNTTSIIQ